MRRNAARYLWVGRAKATTRLAAVVILSFMTGTGIAQTHEQPNAVGSVTADDGGSSSPGDLAWHSLSEAISRASRSGRPIAVFVSAAWCGPCHQMETEVFPSSRVAPLLSQFERARLTFDSFDEKVLIGPYALSEAKWAERLGAYATPTLVFMSSDGAILGLHAGFVPADALVEILTSVAGSGNPLRSSRNSHR